MNLICPSPFRIAGILVLLLMPLWFTSCGTSKAVVEAGSEIPEDDGLITDQSRLERMFINGVRARSLGDTESAIRIFRDVLKEDPQNDAANYELAKLFYELGELASALPHAERAHVLDESNVFYLEQLADMLMVSGKFEEAKDAFKGMTELSPDDMTPYFQLAFIHTQLSELPEALDVYLDIRERFGPDPSLLLEINRIYMVQGKLDKAAETLEELIELDGQDPQYYQMLAKIYETNREPKKAAAVYERMLELEGDNPELLLQAAEIYRMRGDYASYKIKLREAFDSERVDIDGKIAFLVPYIDSVGTNFSTKTLIFELNEKMVAAHENDPKAHAMYGDFLYYEDKKKEARASYLNSLELEKNIYDVWRQVISIDLETSSYDSLVQITDRAIEIFPNQPANYYFNGYGNMQIGDHQQAVKSLKRALPMTSQIPSLRADIYSSLGDAYHNLKEHQLSDEAYQNSLDINPDNVFVLNNYAYYLSLRDENLELAAEMAARANELSPESSSFEDTYAWVLYKLGRYDDAKKWQEKALNHGGRDSAVQLDHYGDILFKLGDTDGAVEYWKKAKENGMDSGVIDRKIADRKLYE